MSQEKSKKIFRSIMMVFGILTIVLAIHIYWVTRPKAPDPHKIVMARIDINNAINQQEADSIKTWLYQQKGVDHVLVNPISQIAIFTFYPSKVSGDQIVSSFQTSFNYNAKRYVPTQEEIDNGCSALPASITQKISAFVKHNF